jgi:prolyl oligopeptidase
MWLLLCVVFVCLAVPARADEGADPYLWLEEVTGDKPLAWVREQNDQSTRELTAS